VGAGAAGSNTPTIRVVAVNQSTHRPSFFRLPLATLGLLAMAIGALASCAPTLSGKARDMFSFGLSCPPDGVSVVPRGRYQPPPVPDPSPPPDVAADPSRLAYWRTHAGAGGQVVFCGDMFEATGCGHRGTYCCSVAQTERSVESRVYTENVAACTLVAKDGVQLVSPQTGIATSFQAPTAR
jgi:hypothetical protein